MLSWNSHFVILVIFLSLKFFYHLIIVNYHPLLLFVLTLSFLSNFSKILCLICKEYLFQLSIFKILILTNTIAMQSCLHFQFCHSLNLWWRLWQDYLSSPENLSVCREVFFSGWFYLLSSITKNQIRDFNRYGRNDKDWLSLKNTINKIIRNFTNLHSASGEIWYTNFDNQIFETAKGKPWSHMHCTLHFLVYC